MIELLLMRHAKSDWTNQLADIERPLNSRGRKDALHMATHLKNLSLIPHRMVVSSSARTRETASLLLNGFNVDTTDLLFEPALYLASRRTICEIADNYAEENKRLLVLAHNPGMDETVAFLANKRPTYSATGKLMPTCAVANFQLDSAEAFNKAGQGYLKQLFRPKEIT
jgi:phosphohistidine phosphatase